MLISMLIFKFNKNVSFSTDALWPLDYESEAMYALCYVCTIRWCIQSWCLFSHLIHLDIVHIYRQKYFRLVCFENQTSSNMGSCLNKKFRVARKVTNTWKCWCWCSEAQIGLWSDLTRVGNRWNICSKSVIKADLP